MRLLIVLLIILINCAPNRPDEYVRYDNLIGTTWWGHDVDGHKVESWTFYCDSVVLWSITYSPAKQITNRGTVIEKGQVTREAKSVGKLIYKDRKFTDIDGDSYLTFDLSWRAYGTGNTPIFDNGVYMTCFIYGLDKSYDDTPLLYMGILGLPNETQFYYTWESTFERLGITLIN